MPFIPGQLETAQLENLSSDPSNLPEGRVWVRTDTDRAKVVLGGAAKEVVTTDQTQTLTGKTIDGDDNTIQDVPIAALKTVGANTNRFIHRDGSGVVTDSKTVPTGDVVGTSDSQTLTNKTYSSAIISLDQVSLNQADIATSSTITALGTSKPLNRFTGSTATEVQGIDATGTNKVVTYFNASSAQITFKNQNAGATATNRIITPTGNDIRVKANESIQWVYDATQTRWVIGAGSGGGGGALVVFGSRGTPRSVATTGITSSASHMSTTDQRQLIFVEGDAAGENDLGATQIEAGTLVGQEIILIGRNNDDFILLEPGNGLDMNGEWRSFEGRSITFVYDGTNWCETARR